MMKNKKFDCVKMKWDIQQQISNEFPGIPDKKIHEIQMAKVMDSPILGPFYKKLRPAKRASTK